ncbi:hypothetical protein BBK82_40815 [Lentzea guizhouensis]|uniref:Uncharacterized protein n=1 Tax=Lentzea guizhouensis TaxID=1586287 RepID=A0A1B2HUE8_9PSEU|nr:hypothetical protein [Lentzea guizhouensis]ANZ41366.1 hypothetical protein BBK82_40815 [Lentzea guizhouensis]
MNQDWTEVAGAIGLFLLLTTVIAVTVWQLGSSWRAKALLNREEAYRALAESAVRSQENTERKLAEISERLAKVERVLQDVE